MPEADVLYADVTFTRTSGNTKETVSSPDETTYSEVKILKTQPPAEQPGSQQEVSNRRSKVTERASLLVVCALLTAALIGLSVDNLKTKKNLQQLKHEIEAMRKNLTEKLCETKPGTTLQPEGPKPTEVNNESCPKCGDRWEFHGGKCYYFSTHKLTWEQSRAECMDQGGDLVKIDSREEQLFLEKTLREKMKEAEDKFWIGLTDSKEEGKWLWVDDSPLDESLTFWSGKEPDNWTGIDPAGEDCVRMGEKGGAIDLKCWFDRSCSAAETRICEKPVQSKQCRCV